MKRIKDRSIKINGEIYNAIKAKVESSPKNYKSVSDLIEQAVLRHLRPDKYNIDGVGMCEEVLSKPLRQVVKSEKRYVFCLMCAMPFLIDKKDDKKSSRVCPSCDNKITKIVNLR
jgi:hypothetical protein